MTHPFHPLAGCGFEFVKRRKNWRADRVYLDDGGQLVVLPAEWPDVVSADSSWWCRRGARRFTSRVCSSWRSWSLG
ncbi:MAG: DUF5372 family protein [Solirubrobacteraceae bacterium]